MPITYTSTIPMATDQISLSQGQILNNFGAIAQLINLNHGNFNAANFGKHTIVNWSTQTFPIAGPAGGDINFFNAVDPATGTNEMWLQKTGGSQIPFTETSFETAIAGGGYTYLPSSLIVKWGAAANSPVVYSVAAGQPAFTTATLIVLVSPISAGGAPNLRTFGYTPLQFQADGIVGSFNWLAIGY